MMRPLVRARSLVLAAALVAAAGPVRAEDAVPPARQVVILVRALAYDANLKTRAGGNAVIAVLHKRGHAASEQMAEEMHRAFKSLEGAKVAGMPLSIARLPYADPATLEAAITAQGIDAVYVCVGLEDELTTIKQVSKKRKIVTMASRSEFVRAGLSLGVFLVDARNMIFVNLAQSREEGAAFGSDLLRLANVIR